MSDLPLPAARAPLYTSLFVQVVAMLLLGILLGVAAPDFPIGRGDTYCTALGHGPHVVRCSSLGDLHARFSAAMGAAGRGRRGGVRPGGELRGLRRGRRDVG